MNAFERKQNVVPVEEAVTLASTLRRIFPAWSVTGLEFTMAV